MYGFHLSDNIVRLRRERKMTQEEVADSFQISEQNDMLLIQAYQMAGELEKAKSYTQIRQYLSMLKLVNTAMSDLSLYMQDMKRCEETIRRMKGMMKLYQL